jgi:hypothetical protein
MQAYPQKTVAKGTAAKTACHGNSVRSLKTKAIAAATPRHRFLTSLIHPLCVLNVNHLSVGLSSCRKNQK